MDFSLFDWPRPNEARKLLGATEPCWRYVEAAAEFGGGSPEAMAETCAAAREEHSFILGMGGCLDAPL